jgi:flavin reductase (DIM6/NTAB) family NADH-FMN oxidoreductase RutF
MLSIDPASISTYEMYKLMTSAIVPRPIALVSSISKGGMINLAPFSYFSGVSSNPPCLMISVARGRGERQKKDTLINIEETGEFVVNISSQFMAEPLVYTSFPFAPEVNEAKEAGFGLLDSDIVRAPRVKESPIHFECKVYKSVDIGDNKLGSTVAIFGEIVKAHVDKEVYSDDFNLDISKIKPIARLGGKDYSVVDNSFEINIPAPKK